MTTINDLSVASSVGSDDKIPLWQNANGVTRALPVSVLDGRYLSKDDVAALAADSKVETFVSSTQPNPGGLPTFVAGTTFSLTLANQYYSGTNIEVFFDGTFQGPDQYSLIGYGLTFFSPIPFGVQNVYIRGGAVRVIGAPSDGTVTTSTIIDGAVTGPKLAAGSVDESKVKSGTALYNRIVHWVDVTDPQFGADPTGTLDSTAAIQAAIDTVTPFLWKGTTRATELATVSGTVFFPRGTYLVSGKIRLAPGLRMLGEGVANDWTSRNGANGTASGGAFAQGSCIKSVLSDFSKYAFDTSPWSNAGVRIDDRLQGGGDSTNGISTQVSGICIENMTFEGSWTAKGFNLAGADLCHLKNVYIKGFTIGIRESAIWYGSYQDVRIVANYRGILTWGSVTDVVRFNTNILYTVDGIAYNPSVSGRDAGDPVPVSDLTQSMIDMPTGLVNFYGNIQGLNVAVENWPQAFLTLNGVDSYRGVYVEGISGIVLRIQGSDQQNCYFEFDTINPCTGDLVWSSNARLTVEVRNNNYTQANFGKLINFLNYNNNQAYVPAFRGVYENGTDTVSGQYIRNMPDDYREGGWVPILGFGGVAAGAQTVSTGKWIRMGRIVVAKFSIRIPTLSGATGNAAISGLPFLPENIDGTDYMGGPIIFSFSAPAGMLAQVQPGVAGIYLVNSAGTILTNASGFSNGLDIRGSVTYMVQSGQ